MGNDQKEISADVFEKLNQEFIKKFGGLTVNSPAKGFWKHNGLTYRDQTIEYIVFIPEAKFNKEIKKSLDEYLDRFKKTFKQLEIFCYYYLTMST